ncbi:MAG: malto-oligosyltrehalose trehalohydrolase [Sulfurifustaceae bacterium]
MPFGAEALDNGTVRFRLWAPGAQAVELCFVGAGAEARFAMTRQAEGWFETVQAVRAGSRYHYRMGGDRGVPDPASRFQPEDVHGPSQVIDPRTYVWSDSAWRGRPWEEVVLYELHVGSFTAEGTYAGLERKLEYLRALGVTAVELMPLADFPGQRSWGYDGVLPYAPDAQYGRPDDLKRLIDKAHALGLMVFLDVVYNHFGPEGNYLSQYAPAFFTDRHHTPWGQAINFDGPGSRTVRDYYIHNALYWLEEYHFDGLRFDAVHAIRDDSTPDILMELADAVARGPGRERHVHLVLENDDNLARYLKPDANGRRPYDGQWNDDIHHAMHVLATAESAGYYADYADAPLEHLGRCLAEGFAYQGDASAFRHGEPRGEPSVDVAPTAFVSFLQNHDQIGNRAFGERITRLAPPERVRALSAIFLLAPSPPMLFMGQEWATERPFPFFCDFGPELAQAVTEGRRKEFARFPEFSDPQARERIPDPNDPATFAQAVLDWDAVERDASADWLAWHCEVLRVRHAEIVPRLAQLASGAGRYALLKERGLQVEWMLQEGGVLRLLANLSDVPLAVPTPSGRIIYKYSPAAAEPWSGGQLPPWAVVWSAG